MSNPNPFRMPNKPRLTIREVLAWLAGGGAPADSSGVMKEFKTTRGDACMRLLRLHRYGYVTRSRGKDGTYTYTLSAFGRKTAGKWGRE